MTPVYHRLFRPLRMSRATRAGWEGQDNIRRSRSTALRAAERGRTSLEWRPDTRSEMNVKTCQGFSCDRSRVLPIFHAHSAPAWPDPRTVRDSRCPKCRRVPRRVIIIEVLIVRPRDKSPSARPVRVEVRSGEEPVTIETVGDGSVTARVGSVEAPDPRLEGPPQVILGLLVGKIGIAEARKKGVKCQGDRTVLRRFGGH
jgi:hypothetical protein